VPFYGPAEFVVKKAKGSIVWDVDNNKYIDFTAGIAVTNLGHSNEILSKIMQKQSKELWHLSNLYINEPAVKLAKNFVKKLLLKKFSFVILGVSLSKLLLRQLENIHLKNLIGIKMR
jgi:acetylornithine/succinyldiaminopimelate/putrescine aminotransferase